MIENNAISGEISRREFLKAAGVVVGGITIGSTALLSGCGYPTAPDISPSAYQRDGDTLSLRLDKVVNLSEVGGSAAIMSDSDGSSLVIAKTGKDEYVVASNECTHREKPLGYDHEAELFICASGKSRFRPDGAVVEGPAENPLRMYRWQLHDGYMVIDLSSQKL